MGTFVTLQRLSSSFFKKTSFLFAILLSFIGISHRLSLSQEDSLKNKDRIVSVYSSSQLYVFGTIVEGTPVTTNFEIKNRGKSAFLIKEVVADAGCSVIFRRNKEIDPNGKLSFSVNFNSNGYTGEVNRKIYVFTSEPGNTTLVFELKGEIVPAIEVKPSFLRFNKGSNLVPQELEVILNSKIEPEKLKIVNSSEKTIKFIKTIDKNKIRFSVSLIQNNSLSKKSKHKQISQQRLVFLLPSSDRKNVVKVLPIYIEDTS